MGEFLAFLLRTGEEAPGSNLRPETSYLDKVFLSLLRQKPGQYHEPTNVMA
jgi:hypothetical protein